MYCIYPNVCLSEILYFVLPLSHLLGHGSNTEGVGSNTEGVGSNTEGVAMVS